MRRFLSGLLLLSFLLLICMPATAAASRTIRVGCPSQHVFIERQKDGRLRGYLVAYLNRISDTTDWQYEYVMDSWENCLAMLRNGEIDVLSCVERTPWLEKEFLFSKPYVHDTLAIYARQEDDNFFYNDPDSLQNGIIGIATDMPHRREIFQFLETSGLQPQLQYFNDEEDLTAALYTGKIDLALLRGTMAPRDAKIVTAFAPTPFYFITTPQNQALHDELDYAIAELQTAEPLLEGTLVEEFYGHSGHRLFSYTRQEMDFIHNTAPLRVICLQEQPPFEYYQNGKAVGIYPDLLRLLARESDLPIEFLPASTMQEALDMIEQDQADAVLSTYRNMLQPSDDMLFSEPLLTEKYTIVGRRDFIQPDDDVLTIAVPRVFRGIQDFIHDHHPNWEIIPCDTSTEAFHLVDNGQADILAINTIRLQADDPLTLYPSLTTLPTLSMNIPMNIAFSSREPKLLRSIFNKSIARLEPKEVEHIVLDYTIVTSHEFTPSYLLVHYPLQTGGTIALLVLILLSGGFVAYHSHVTRRNNVLLRKKNQELEAALRNLESTSIDRDNYKFFAEKDLLTGLYNKLTIENAVQERLTHSGSISHALIIIDLDHFKAANDTYGHQYGDELLQRFAARLQDTLRQEDLIGRFGGDEFIIFLKGVHTPESLRTIARKLGDVARGLDNRNGHPVVSASIGIALSPQHGKSYEELFQAADTALYAVKQHGRDNFCIAGRDPETD